jgi:ABC-type phosphate transport system substrate-binding protein
MSAIKMTRALVLASLSLAALCLAACGKNKAGGGASSSTAAHASGTPQTIAVLDAWRGAGLAPQAFAALNPPPYVATYCERGTVAGVEALVCEYADDGALDRGQQQLKDEHERNGVHTGVTIRTKRTLLSIVDREQRDPNGKTINQLVQAFRKL